MKNLTTYLLSLMFAVVVGVFTSSCAGPGFEAGTSIAMQQDFDVARMRDIETLGKHIEKYKEVVGIYPLQGQTELPNYVHIATKEQTEQIHGKPPYEHVVTSVSTFIDELEHVLGPDIEIPFDPQRVAVNKPNFYIYLIVDDTYFLAVHLFESYPFANPVSDHYHKLEISNAVVDRRGVWLLSELLSSEAFVAAKNRELHKPGYVDDLRQQLGGKSAF